MDDGLLNEFVVEGREHLADIEADLLTIEERGADIDEKLVNKVFRAAHSIKGASGFFGLNKVKELSHGAETVLDLLRSRQMVPTAEVVNVLLAAFDRLRDMINHCSESERVDIRDLVLALSNLATASADGGRRPSLGDTVTLRTPQGEPITLPRVDVERVRRLGQQIYRVEYDLIHDVERQGKNVLEVFRDLLGAGEILDCSLNFEAVGTLDDPLGTRLPLDLVYATVLQPQHVDVLFPIPAERIGVLAVPEGPRAAPRPAASPPTSAPPAPPASEAASAASAPGGPAAVSSAGTVEETIRVPVGVLETLMNLAGELVLSRNQLGAAVNQNNQQALAIANQRINQVTSELQDAIMQTRLQPVGNVFAKFPRVIRDLSASLGKEVRIDIRGKEVALDKTLIEGLSDPLTHMIRNAVDHGVEPPEERARAGKEPAGTVRVEARHEAGQVVVEISDDGRGLDPEKIAASAREKELVSAERLAAMSPQEKAALIFLPGLSTASKVSDVSGRGVGMDVVKTNLDRLGGKVEILSEPGKGSTFRIKLPLTLAILPSLVVSVEGERFALPQVNVEELLRVRPEEVRNRIEVVGDAEVLVLRDRLIPLVRFADVLGVTPTYAVPGTGTREPDRRVSIADRRSPRHPAGEIDGEAGAEVVYDRRGADRRRSAEGALEIAVLTTGIQTYALMVTAFHDTEEIVVKPLGRDLKGLGEYSGATILGDGTVALIVDVAGLASKANLATVSGSALAQQRAAEAERERFSDLHSLLLFHNGPGETCATPLDAVLRVERIRPDQVESAGGRRTVQYRGGSLPLVTLSDVANVGTIAEGQDLAVMVSSIRGREVGLLGAMPVDVIETRARIDQATHRQPGISGSAIIGDRTTLIADPYELVEATWPEWGAEHARTAGAAPAADDGAVLLAEDSDFFRAQVSRFLQEDGYTVLAAPDGQAAWELLLENVDRVRLVVTDIEMPRLNGLELTRRIRADGRTAALPVIAVTSLAGDDDVARGKAAGIDDYQVKLDRDRLLERIGRELRRARPGPLPSPQENA